MSPLFEEQTKIISFDCYGTLVQWSEVLQERISSVLKRRGASIDANVIVDDFHSRSHQIEQNAEHILYKVIVRRALADTFAERCVQVTASDVEEVAESIKTMGPHPETREVLLRLRTRYRLAILTNSDDDIIAHNLRLLGAPIDYVITAEQADAYKPSRRIFEFAHQKIGVDKAETVHVAMSMNLDIQACHELGIRAVWINRLRSEGNPGWLPYFELPNLVPLPALLGV